jgi:hypothetical protein
MTAPTALLAQEAKREREGDWVKLVYLEEQEDEDD